MRLESKHIWAERYKKLCLISDEVATKKFDMMGKTVVCDYEVVDREYDVKSNFKGVAYKNINEVVICFVGTDSKSLKDHATNLKMGLGKPTAQMLKALSFAKRVNDKFMGYRIVCSGHSEGGSEAQFVGLSLGLPTYTYNAFSIPPAIIDVALINSSGQNFDYLINNYRDPKDAISKLFYDDIGNTYIVENPNTSFFYKFLFCRKSAHSLKNMGDCATAIPIAFYKKEHFFFVDKITPLGLMLNNLG